MLQLAGGASVPSAAADDAEDSSHAWDQMAVNIEGDRDAGVTRALTRYLRVNTGSQKV